MVFSEESVSSTLEEAKPLLKKHWEEAESHYGIPLNPDYDLYLKLQAEGAVKSYAVRSAERKLIGYALYFLQYSPHYKDVLMAKQDLFFIDEVFRTDEVFRLRNDFVEWCFGMLRQAGAKFVFMGVKAHGKTFQEYLYMARL